MNTKENMFFWTVVRMTGVRQLAFWYRPINFREGIDGPNNEDNDLCVTCRAYLEFLQLF